MSGGGGAGEEEEAAMRLIESLKQIVKRPLPDITAALRDSDMNPNEAVIRLLNLGDNADQDDLSLNDNNKDEDEDSPSSNDGMSSRDVTPDKLLEEPTDSDDEDPYEAKKIYRPPKKKAKVSALGGQEVTRSRSGGIHTHSNFSGYKGTGSKKNTIIRSSYQEKQASRRRKRGNRSFACKYCDKSFDSPLGVQRHTEAKHSTA